MSDRSAICASASAKLDAAVPLLGEIRAVLGFDGFVDEILAVVEKRLGPTEYTAVPTIARLGEKISNAANQSSNYELIVKQVKLGGNGPIMANAAAAIGLDVTYIGNLGYPHVHTVFEPFAQRAKLFSIGEPGHTDALEFDDGKLMLGKLEGLHDVTWENLLERTPSDDVLSRFRTAHLIGSVNWTMLPHMNDLWLGLLSALDGRPADSPRPIFFADLADPEKRPTEDLREACKIVARFQKHCEVVFGLNFKESLQVAAALGIPADQTEQGIEDTASRIREALGVSCIVIHPRSQAAAATAEGSARFKGPFVYEPKISTGAGDHFNAGFCLGRLLGMTLEESLCVGTATSGYYVRTATSASGKQLADFVEALPEPEA